MEKLKKIILQLNEEKYNFIQNTLISNHSNKFLQLLQYYRNKGNDNLTELLNTNENALYVLKSRLYDKIQKHLVDFSDSKSSDQNNNYVSNLDDYLIFYPRDTAIAILHEIERKYLLNNDYINLINIYSTLKKAYHNSDKYYYYTQLYNKHVAFAISSEKANDVLLNFNKTLANYYFSDSENDLNTLMLLKDEIKNICFLNRSPNIELILNIILIQLFLFTESVLEEEEPVEDLLTTSDDILKQYPNDPQVKKFEQVIDFLRLEYYNKINQNKKTLVYFEKINDNHEKWLLYGNYCLAFKFLFTKIDVIQNKGAGIQLVSENDDVLHDPYDFYSIVALKFYIGIKKYFQGQIKESISILNKILDDSSFVNFAFMEFEIKLTLAYIYFRKKELELAGNILKNLSRKVSGADYKKYNNVKAFIKLLNLMLEEKEVKAFHEKVSTAFEQFNYHNFSGRKILKHLQKDLDELILIPKRLR